MKLRALLPAIASIASLGWPCLTLAAEGPTIADLAPPGTMVVIDVGDTSRLVDAFDKSTLRKAWNDAEMRALLLGMAGLGDGPETPGMAPEGLTTLLNDFKSTLEKVNLKPEDLPWPTGAAGIAVFDHPTLAEKFKNAPGGPPPGVIAMADFGARAADFDAALNKALDELVRKGEATVDETQESGATVRTVKLVKLDEWWKTEAQVRRTRARDEFRKHYPNVTPEELGDYDPAHFITDELPASLKVMQEFYVARKSNLALATNVRAALDGALDSLSGKPAETLASVPAFRSAEAKHPAGAHLTQTFLIDPFVTRMEAEAAAGHPVMPGQLEAMFGPQGELLFAILGFKGTKAVTSAITLNADQSAAVQVDISMLQPKKSGLLTLLESAPAGFVPPSFAPADVSTVSTTHVKFPQLISVIREQIKLLPDEHIRTQLDAQLGQGEAFAAPLLAGMGPEVISCNAFEHPLGPESDRGIVAIRMKDPLPLRNLLTSFAVPAGAKARDFEGNQIWELQPGGEAGGAPSLGIGFGFVFIGKPKDIENALRQAARPESGLASSKEFAKSSKLAGPGGLMYIHMSTPQLLEWSIWSGKHANEIAMSDPDFDPAEAAKPAEIPKWLKEAPSINTISRYMGDLIIELHSVDSGFDAKVRLLEP